jgi:hypothetical protein
MLVAHLIKNKIYSPLLILLLAGGVFVFSGCPAANVIDSVPIDQEAYEWIDGFQHFSVGDTIPFSNECVVKVIARRNSDPARVSDCQVEGFTQQCQLEMLTLEFDSPFVEDNYYLTIFLFPRRRVIINYSAMSLLEPEILRLDMSTDSLEVPQPESFSVSLIRDYNYESRISDAISVQTINAQLLFASLPPANFILLKKEGIVEWQD